MCCVPVAAARAGVARVALAIGRCTADLLSGEGRPANIRIRCVVTLRVESSGQTGRTGQQTGALARDFRKMHGRTTKMGGERRVSLRGPRWSYSLWVNRITPRKACQLETVKEGRDRSFFALDRCVRAFSPYHLIIPLLKVDFESKSHAPCMQIASSIPDARGLLS